MATRRACVLLLASVTAGALIHLVWLVLSPGGWTIPKLVMLAAFAGTTPWTGLCLANGLIGFSLLRARAAMGENDHSSIPQTAIAVTVRNEDMRKVLPPLRRLLHELDLAGAGDSFSVFVLSDTLDALASKDEQRAVAAFRAEDRDPSRIHYRRRAVNAGFKAGNLMDFLDHHADGFELMLVLDADSQMSARAVLRLVDTMQANPKLAIVQHLTVGLPASSALPRLFQFGMRAGMRIWATAQAWWQGDEGPYWGHNAIVRIAPFRAHARLPELPNGQHILSHDQIEAALLGGAGWGVRVLPDEDGSWELNPPALPEFLGRELRWLTGNFQYLHLFGLPGLRPMGRCQLGLAVLLFSGAPLYLLFLLAAALAAATDAASPFPAEPALHLTGGWLCALYAPKLLGYLEIALSPDKRERYGGLVRFTAGALAEFAFTLMLDAISAVAKTGAMLRIAFGMRAAWMPQNRAARSITWSEASRLLWRQTLIGLLVFVCFGSAGWVQILWALPFAGGLLFAIPFCVVTADERLGNWLRDQQIAALPEEHPGRVRATGHAAHAPQGES